LHLSHLQHQLHLLVLSDRLKGLLDQLVLLLLNLSGL
jgi:hypothetical protein